VGGRRFTQIREKMEGGEGRTEKGDGRRETGGGRTEDGDGRKEFVAKMKKQLRG